MNKVNLEISWNTLWRVMIFLGVLALIIVAKEALGALFIAIVVSLAINPAVAWLRKKGIHRILGTLIVFLFIIFIFLITIYFIVPVIAGEIQGFTVRIGEILSSLGFEVPETVIEGVSNNLNQILNSLRAINVSIAGTISTVFHNLVLGITTLIIAFYLSVEENGAERLIRKVLPRAYESSVLKVFKKFKDRIRYWAVAQLGLSFIVGIIVAAGLWLLGVKYPLVLGLLAAVFELVPLIGPILSGVVGFLVAIGDSFTLGIYVAIFFILVQQLENNVLIPIIFKKSMKVHPVIVLVALLAGGYAAGIIGVILSVPIALLAQEMINYFAERKASHAKGELNI